MQAPFRADQVGSLLRPEALAKTRAAWKRGEVTAEALREAEDAAIAEVVKKQESIGLKAVTDGEFRRDWWHLDFLAQLDGVTLTANEGEKFKVAGQSEQPPIASVTGRVACSRPVMADHFAFLKSVVTRTPKMTSRPPAAALVLCSVTSMPRPIDASSVTFETSIATRHCLPGAAPLTSASMICASRCPTFSHTTLA